LSIFPTTAAVVLLVALAAVPSAAAAKAKANPKCPTEGVTRAKSVQARIYQVQARVRDEKETRTYGCWLPTGDRIRLDERCDPDNGSPSGYDACHDVPEDFALNGKYVAVATDSLYYGESGNSYTKIVRGKLGSKPVATQVARINNRQGGEIGPLVWKLFISRRGAIAYAATIVEEGTHQIGFVSAGGKESVLDTGEDIDEKSLAVAGATVTWTRGGVQKSAPFS
jgi:hypothetical protein